MNIETVFPDVANILTDVLVLDEGEVALEKRLVTDLNAESIDFLDIMFQVERKFDVKIPRGQIEKDVRGALEEGEFEKEGVLTEKGLEALRAYLSEVPEDYFKKEMKVGEIPTLLTVETLCKLVLKAKAKKEKNESATRDVAA